MSVLLKENIFQIKKVPHPMLLMTSSNENDTITTEDEEDVETMKKEKATSKAKPRKVFKCDYSGCHKTYLSKENLKLHYLNIHLKEKPYQCSYCGLKFSHRNGKIYHERKVHTLYFPYKCNYENCSHYFVCKSALNFHVKINHKKV